VSIGKVILVVLATLVIFSTGLITGVVLNKQVAKPAPNAPMFPPGPGWQQFFHRIQVELDLTAEQDQRIGTLLRDSQERARGLARAEFGKVREQIRAELTPAQKDKFERLVKERQRRMQEMRPLENRPFRMTNGP
jgi:Spy/CpxP family protein refolding chaperone